MKINKNETQHYFVNFHSHLDVIIAELLAILVCFNGLCLVLALVLIVVLFFRRFLIVLLA